MLERKLAGSTSLIRDPVSGLVAHIWTCSMSIEALHTWETWLPSTE